MANKVGIEFDFLKNLKAKIGQSIGEQQLSTIISKLQSLGYQNLEYMTKGGQNIILKAYSLTYGQVVALKIQMNGQQIDLMKQEFQMIKQISENPFVVKCFNLIYIENIEATILVLELCEMSLHDEIEILKKKNIWFTEEQIVNLFIQLYLALIHIHSHGIAHFDVSPKNILKTKQGSYVISDFENAKEIQSDIGTTHSVKLANSLFSASEIYNPNQQKGQLADVFSLGLVLLCVLGYNINKSTALDISQGLWERHSNQLKNKDLFLIICQKLCSSDQQNREPSHKLMFILLPYLSLNNNNIQFLENSLDSIFSSKNNNVKKNIHYMHQLELYYNKILAHLYELKGKMLKPHSNISSSNNINIQKNNDCLDYLKQNPSAKGSKILLNIGESYSNLGIHKKAQEYTKISYDMKKELKELSKEEEIKYINTLSYINSNLDNHEEDLKLTIESINSKKEQNQVLSPIDFYNIGVSLIFLEEYELALQNLNQALQLYSQESKNSIQVANCYSRIGQVHFFTRNWKMSLQYFKKLLVIDNSSLDGDCPLLSNTYQFIGRIYTQLEKHQEALEYQKQAHKINIKIYHKKHYKYINSLMNLARSKINYGSIEKGLEDLQQAKQLIYDSNSQDVNYQTKAQLFLYFGDAYKLMKKSQVSIENYEQAYENIYKHNQNDYGQLIIYLKIIIQSYVDANRSYDALHYNNLLQEFISLQNESQYKFNLNYSSIINSQLQYL